MRQTNQVAKRTFDFLGEGLVDVGDHRKIENGETHLSISILGTYMRGVKMSFACDGTEMRFIRNANGDYFPFFLYGEPLDLAGSTMDFSEEGDLITHVFEKKQSQQTAFAGKWAAHLKKQGILKAL